MRVVLISPPFETDYMRNARCDFVSLSRSSWFPIWLGQAGAWLEGQGHVTRLLDAQVAGLSKQDALRETLAFRPDVVAVYTGRLSEASDVEFADAVAEKVPGTVFVGPYASIDPSGLLARASKTRFLIQREFDLPLEELASGKDPATIQNLAWKDSGQVRVNPIRPLLTTETLDRFPLTTEYFHRQLDVTRYKTPSELWPFMDVMSGRGCAWGRCNFCLWVQTFVPGSVYNLRSIEHFMGEFDYLREKLPEVRGVMIQDDMLTNSRAREISEALLRRGSTVAWSCYAKPNSKLTPETLRLMRKSGCLNLHVGFESGDDEILKNIDKGSTVEQAREFAAQAHEAGLRIHGDFALGHLGDTRATMDRTVRLAREINPHTAQFQIMIPFRGTRFWKQLEERRALNEAGEPSYEQSGGASAEEIRAAAKRAYREFYISLAHLRKVLAHPRDYLFNRLDQYARAIPAVFWRRWRK
ncbi:MAG: radical SAM protein [Bdellovibrionales bacterium]|nr:radical SAM protein [Bdellovibrionales bacterium]